MNELQKKFLGVLQQALQSKSSDVHFMAGSPPSLRTALGLAPVECPPFTNEELIAIAQFMVNDPKKTAADLMDLDGSFEIKNLGRFRYNIYKTSVGASIVLRVIAAAVPTLEGLKLPEVLKTIADASRGLVLVTGATGSGKSSTLAAIINYLNDQAALHILTVEDPIEFAHPQKKSRVSQREIGRDTESFATALRSALRQDPDVILVGELRDYETLDICLKAAETGHLVFSTAHTSDAMKTIGRLVSLFPPEEQKAARLRLAENLHAIISQRLVPGVDGSRIVAQEILINNLGIRECIADETRTGEIRDFVEKGKEVSGMQTFDQHLVDLVQTGVVSMEVALANSTTPSDFQRNFSFGNTASSPSSDMGGPSLNLESYEEKKPELSADDLILDAGPTTPTPSKAPVPPAAGGPLPNNVRPLTPRPAAPGAPAAHRPGAVPTPRPGLAPLPGTAAVPGAAIPKPKVPKVGG